MAIDFCNETQRARVGALFSGPSDLAIKPLYTYLCPVIILVCFFSIFSNAMLMSISRQSKFMNKSPILLLSLNLAVTDLIASLLNGLGILFNSYLPKVFDIKMGQCSMLMFEVFRCAALIASALHLLALAFVHYRGTVNPLHYRSTIFYSQHLSRTINIISICCWFIPLTLMIVWFSATPCQGFQAADCDYLFLLGFTYRYMYLVVFSVPLLLMSIIYLRIFIIISRHQRGLIGPPAAVAERPGGSIISRGVLATAAGPLAGSLPPSLMASSLERELELRGTQREAHAAEAEAEEEADYPSGFAPKCPVCSLALSRRPASEFGEGASVSILGEQIEPGDWDDEAAAAAAGQQHGRNQDNERPQTLAPAGQQLLHLIEIESACNSSESTAAGTADVPSATDPKRNKQPGPGPPPDRRDDHQDDGCATAADKSAAGDRPPVPLADQESATGAWPQPPAMTHANHCYQPLAAGGKQKSRHPGGPSSSSSAGSGSETDSLLLVETDLSDRTKTQTSLRREPQSRVESGRRGDDQVTSSAHKSELHLLNVSCQSGAPARPGPGEECGAVAAVSCPLTWVGHDGAHGDGDSLGSGPGGAGEANNWDGQAGLLPPGTQPTDEQPGARGAASDGGGNDGPAELQEVRSSGQACAGRLARTSDGSRPRAQTETRPRTQLEMCVCDNNLKQFAVRLSRANTIGCDSPRAPASVAQRTTTRPKTRFVCGAGAATAAGQQDPPLGKPSISPRGRASEWAPAARLQLRRSPSSPGSPAPAPADRPQKLKSESTTATSSSNSNLNARELTVTTMTSGHPNYSFSSLQQHQSSGIGHRHAHELQRLHFKKTAAVVPPPPTSTNTKALVTTLLILGTYCVSYIPAITFQVLTCIDHCPYPLNEVPYGKRLLYGSISTLLLVAKSVVDPLIYSYRMKEIQVAISRYMSKRRSKSSSQTNSLHNTSQRFAFGASGRGAASAANQSRAEGSSFKILKASAGANCNTANSSIKSSNRTASLNQAHRTIINRHHFDRPGAAASLVASPCEQQLAPRQANHNDGPNKTRDQWPAAGALQASRPALGCLVISEHMGQLKGGLPSPETKADESQQLAKRTLEVRANGRVRATQSETCGGDGAGRRCLTPATTRRTKPITSDKFSFSSSPAAIRLVDSVSRLDRPASSAGAATTTTTTDLFC